MSLFLLVLFAVVLAVCLIRACGAAKWFGAGLKMFVQMVPFHERCPTALLCTHPTPAGIRLFKSSRSTAFGLFLVRDHVHTSVRQERAVLKWTCQWCGQPLTVFLRGESPQR